jgi:hypothetical protein
MSRIRIIGLALVAVFAMTAVAASPAFAADSEQLFKQAGTKQKFKSTSGVGKLTANGQVVECKKDKGSGELNAKQTASVKNVVVTFEECKSEKEGVTCEVKSKGAGKTNEVATVKLKGELGEVAAAEATSEVGLLLEPESGTAFVILEGTCLQVSPTEVTGSVAGEVTPVGKNQLTGKLEFKVPGGAQAIKTFERSTTDAVVKPSLKVFGLFTATQETSSEETFEELTEVVKGL